MSENYLNLHEFKFSSGFDHLRTINHRSKCPQCNMMRKFYCYDCAVPISHQPPKPAHRLPFRVIIVRHNSEKPSKSSIIPLKLSYPEDVSLHTFTQPDRFDRSQTIGSIQPAFPEDIDWRRTAIVFPGESAKTVQEIDQSLWQSTDGHSDPSSGSIQNIVVIDSTWSTALQVIQKTPELQSVPHMIKLQSTNQTIFWRHQKIGRECLATCEAVYVFFRELWDVTNRNTPYDRRYDDILFYYVYIHTVVNDHYRKTKRHRGHLPDYALIEDNSE
jgi:DTW domain-containing protein YfiP